MMRSQTRDLIIPTLALAAVALGGCASAWRPASPMATTEAPNPIEVSVSRLRHPVPANNGDVRPADQADLARFVAASEPRPGERISVLRSMAPADIAAAEQVAGALARLGLAPVVVPAPEHPAGWVEVVIDRYLAAAHDCPNWTKPAGGDSYNHMPSNFGCADQNNLAAMIVDPHDLIAGREPGPAVGDAAARPAARYEAGMTPGLGATAPAAASPSPAAASGSTAGGAAPPS
ncbi:MAG TPA: CpaD family pilus assembly lipoprotein [Caulobacteraceae bacterium]|jgi:pilus assembly protein CpaD|nr:CpaD family pilus assembly lipoprotein [Caulobacteraceae bacterium]